MDRQRKRRHKDSTSTRSEDPDDKKHTKSKKQKELHEVETTPGISLDDSGILGTPINQQKDKKRRKKVDQDALLKPKKLQKHKLRKKKQKEKVATTTDVSEICSDDPEALVKLKKIIDELSGRVNELTESVKKLEKTSDLLDKEKETPKKKVVECCFEAEDAFIEHPNTIFVEGFKCSPPRTEIKSALIKHFSPCGEVSRVSIPFHCQTGVPMGFAFINMKSEYVKALTLDGSYLDGLRLKVTMAVKRSEYYFYTNRKGCDRCGIALSKHVNKLRSEKLPGLLFIPNR